MKTLPVALLTLILVGTGAPALPQISFRAASSATAAGITPAFRSAASAVASGGTLSISRPSGVAANDVLMASIAVIPISQTIVPPAGWTLVRRLDNPGPTANSLAVYRKVAAAGEPASYVWGVSGASFAVGGIQAFTGVDTANPLDIENGQNTPSSVIHVTPSITTTVGNAMIVTSHAYASSRPWTVQSGLTESFDRQSGASGPSGESVVGARVLQLVAGATGEKQATATASFVFEPDAGNAHILALRPASVSLVISTPAGTAAGDVMVAAIACNNASAMIAAPSGWTLVRRIDNASTTSNSLAVYRKTAAAGEPASHAWTIAGGTFLVGGIQSFSGVDPVNPINIESGQSTVSGVDHDTPSVTTTEVNTMLVTAHAFASSRTWSPQAGLTEAFDRRSGANSATGQSIAGGYQPQPIAGASGAKRSTASADADVGNTHILALRLPVTAAPALYFIHADHLNTPRLVANAQGQTLWRWGQQEPFGVNVPDENPSGLGTFEFPMRFPGQYFDKETGLFQNWFRDYDASIGRYVESDLIGISGGLNTYAYVDGSPLIRIDLMGLQAQSCAVPCDPKICVGKARVLRGNPRLIGRQGAFPGVRVAAGSAAVIPDQFGVAKSGLTPHIDQISGTIGTKATFCGVTDVIGGRSPDPKVNVRTYLQNRYPGLLILELPSISQDLGIVDIEIIIPSALPCPTGTVQKQ